MNTSRASSRSACSVTVPARVFSMGMTATVTSPACRWSNTSAERAQGNSVQPGTMRREASWLKEPGSPWMATLIRERYPEDGAKQMFFEQQRVHTVGIVTRNGFRHMEPVTLVKRERRGV